MLRYLKHTVVRNRQKFNPKEDLSYKILLNVSEEFDQKLKAHLNESIGFDYSYLSNPDGRDYKIYRASGTKLIWTTTDKITLEQLEKYIVRSWGVETNCLSSLNGLFRRKIDLENACDARLKNKEDQIRRLLDYDRQYNETKDLLENFEKNLKKLRKIPFTPDGKVLFKFANVFAEDTEAEGDEIELGDLTFASTLEGRVTIIEGTNPRPTQYCNEAYHPHHLGDAICLGSQEADFRLAMNGFQFDVAGAILHKFAHSYTSTDSAGMYWKRWAGLEMSDDSDDDDHYIETRDEYYPESECRWSDTRDEWIHQDDARWSNYHDTYLYDDDCVWSNRMYDYIERDVATELVNGDYVHEDDAVELENTDTYIHYEDAFEYDGMFYAMADSVEDYNGDMVPVSLTVHSTELDAYILKSEAVEHNGDWYPKDEVPQTEEVDAQEAPTVENTNEDTQQPPFNFA